MGAFDTLASVTDAVISKTASGSETVLYGGTDVSAYAVFEREALVPELDHGVEVLKHRPVLTLEHAILAADPEQGAAVAIDGVPYTVSDPLRDGIGSWRLVLQKV